MELQKLLSEAASKLAVISDDTRYSLCCDVVINGNVYAPELEYDWVGEKPDMLLGTEYLLIREEFQRPAGKEPPWRDPPERALVTFGGSDMNNSTPDAVRAFNGFGLEVDVIIGPGFKNEDEIEEAAAETDAESNLLKNPDDLPRRMFEADLAVSATGSSIYELLLTGTPVLAIPQTDNQIPISQSLSSLGAIAPLNTNKIVSFEGGVSATAEPGLVRIDSDEMTQELRESISDLVVDSELRRELRQRGMSLVDGKGRNRIYNHISQKVSHV
jgi:spore coat polysaccharide biosynthesis predicted glycosyltransferase SpsG